MSELHIPEQAVEAAARALSGDEQWWDRAPDHFALKKERRAQAQAALRAALTAMGAQEERKGGMRICGDQKTAAHRRIATRWHPIEDPEKRP